MTLSQQKITINKRRIKNNELILFFIFKELAKMQEILMN